MFADGVSVNTYETTIIASAVVTIPITGTSFVTGWYSILSSISMATSWYKGS
jgi:hypothetical protein